MNALELLNIISTGETSKVQFKEDMPQQRDALLKEIVAMSNTLGGVIIMGVEDVSGISKGLSPQRIEEYDKLISQMADNVKPPVYITTEVVNVGEEKNPCNLLVIHVPEGINKPYKTERGEIYVKQGANKRLLSDNAEIMRLFQQSANLMADEMEVYGTSISDIDERLFSNYFEKEFGMAFEEKGLSYEQALKAKRIIRNSRITLAGLLFFGKDPQSIKPAFTVKLVSYFGNELSGSEYRSKPEDLKGTIPDLFERSLIWVKANLRSLQKGREFNSIGILEIPEVALVELIQNALLHRSYFKNAPVRILIFDNRVEIISPGKLPNSLTVEDIKYGNPVIRNNQMVAFATRLMPFSGLGSGITRALRVKPDIEFINDTEGEQFRVIIPRSDSIA